MRTVALVARAQPGLRERKKQQTRQALIEAALRLFAEKGYDRTTIADIAAAADVSPRTFFGYFSAKEDVLFAGTDQRMAAIAEAFDAMPPQATNPLEAVRHLVEHVMAKSDDLAGPDRLAILLAKPELQAQGLQRLIAAGGMIADRLRRAYPDQLDDTLARALAGAVVGALVAVVLGGIEHRYPPDRLRTETQRALALLEGGLRTVE
jgi:AcrR family transcriptional regulator